MTDQRLDALLVMPPYSRYLVYSLYPAPYWLANHLTESGFKADVLDLNRACLTLLTDGKLLSEEHHKYSNERKALEAKTQLTPREVSQYQGLLDRLGHLTLVLKHLADIAQPGNLERLIWVDPDARPDDAESTQEHRRYTNLFYGIAEDIFLSRELDVVVALGWSPGIRKAMDTERAHRFRDLMRPLLKAELDRSEPRMVGISVPFCFNILPALLIAEEVRSLRKNVHISFGGPVITLSNEADMRSIFELGVVDSLVKYDGQVPIVEMAEVLRNSADVGRINNVFVPGKALTIPAADNASDKKIFYDRSRTTYRFSEKALEKVPRERPHQIAVLQSTGCYWGKCTFCDYLNIYETRRYIPRPAAVIVDDMEHYVKLGFKKIYLVTDSLPPKHAKDVAQEILRRGLKVVWNSYMKIDQKFDLETMRVLRDSGFERPTVGLESSNTRLLDIVKKGYDEKEVRRFLNDVRRIGFPRLRMNIILDIPTTRYEEAMGVYEFCREHKDIADQFELMPFELTSTSEIARNPETYGIQPTEEKIVNSGNIHTIRHRDPAGLTEEEKMEIRQLYDSLNREIFLDIGYGGSLRRIMKATSLEEIESIHLSLFASEELITDEVKFSPAGERLKGVPRYIVFVLGPRYLQGMVGINRGTAYLPKDFVELYNALSQRRRLAPRDIAEHLETEFGYSAQEAREGALTFIQSVAKMNICKNIWDEAPHADAVSREALQAVGR